MTKPTYFGKKNGVAIGLGVTSIALATVLRTCSPHVEPPQPTPNPPAVVCPSAPVRGDGRCEFEKGEHDPSSPTYDEASCGRCGDGTPQDWEIPSPGAQPRVALPPGVRPMVCPADFACGNGQIDRDLEFAVVMPVQNGSPTYKHDVLRYTETCNQNESRPGMTYCEADCGNQQPAPRPTGSSSSRRTPRTGDDTPAPTVTAAPPSGQCPAEVTQRLASRAAAGLMGNPGAVRSAAGASDNVGVRASVAFSVNNGVANTRSISLSCPGCSGGSISPGTVNLSSVALGWSGSCSGTLPVTVPPG